MKRLDVDVKRALLMGAAMDLAAVLAGICLWLLTGSAMWIAAGVLLGSGFLIPAIIKLVRTQR